MIQAEFLQYSDPRMTEVFSIRNQVFTNEQGVASDIERDEKDVKAWHAYVYDNEISIGTGRLIIQEGEFLIGRIAVLYQFRGQAFGDLIVKMLIDKAFREGAETCFVHSQLQVIEFYKKIGFIPFGDTYEESGIMHQSMYIKKEMINKCSSH